jgi:adenylylsulfate kinase-like enzyme
VSEIYKSKENLIIIELTGRTGAGCSAVAKILSTSKFKELDIEGDKNHSSIN